MVREFLPAMIKKNHGHVVTIASMASFLVLAGNVDYSCSKASALAFNEGLASELKARYNAPEVRTT
jgi:short-subunit dehydrogenase